MSRLVFIIAIVTVHCPIFAQRELGNDTLCWTEDLKLKWSDFRGKPDTSYVTYMGVRATAATHANVQARAYLEAGLPNFIVLTYFIRSKSWTTDTDESHGISHEQLHFDIAELYARKIRKGIAELRQKETKEMNIYVDLVNMQLKNLEEKNRNYDLQTGHGTIEFIQEEWEQNIRKELNTLSKYRSTVKICKCK